MADPVRSGVAGLAPECQRGENVCPGCGTFFTCGMNAGHARCWCSEQAPTFAVPAVAAGSKTACFCPDCLRRLGIGERAG